MSSTTGQTQITLALSSPSSAALNAATTPGMARAAVKSIRLILACACGLRTICMCRVPGSWMLSVQLVVPVSSRPSSLRRRDWPIDGAVTAGRSAMSVIVPPLEGGILRARCLHQTGGVATDFTMF